MARVLAIVGAELLSCTTEILSRTTERLRNLVNCNGFSFFNGK